MSRLNEASDRVLRTANSIWWFRLQRLQGEPLGNLHHPRSAPARMARPCSPLIFRQSWAADFVKYVLILTAVVLGLSTETSAQRSDLGLIALYDFANPDGELVVDRSGNGDPLNLKVSDPIGVERAAGWLSVKRSVLIRSEKPARKVVDAVKRTGQLTVEAWVEPANLSQNGPARIVTLSKSTADRCMTLGQDRDRYEVRFRTNKTDANGLPATLAPAKSLKTRLQHLVYARDQSGKTKLFLNGNLVSEAKATGDLSPWDNTYHLALANELTSDRPWLGAYRLVAIYNRTLSETDVQRHYQMGAGETQPVKLANRPQPKPAHQPKTPSVSGQRVARGLQVLYDFAETQGKTVRDRSGIGKPLDLTIAKPSAVRRAPGMLEFKSKTIIRSDQPATRLSGAIKRSGEVTVEAWLTPANTKQSGPARIVTLSKDSVNRNVTLGQDASAFAVRMRSTGTSTNGIPSTDTKKKIVQPKLTHVVYTRQRGGAAKIYLNGELASTLTVGGDLRNWDVGYQIALGDELSGGRPWLGKLFLVAIYDRDLSPREIKQNYRAGASAKTQTIETQIAKSPNAQLFEQKVAPLFAKHCLECHDASTHQGGLNLARKGPAFEGSDSGKSIVAKNANESLVWQSVEHDEMPHDRPPLTADEKATLKTWIDKGADWTLDFIDPAIYTHEGRTNQNWVQRLTVREYITTVRDTVGVDIAKDASELLPADKRADGFSNTAYNLNVDLQHVDAYAKLAERVVAKMNAVEFARGFRSKLSLTDKDMRGLIEEMGKWILRGPLTDQEVVLYRGISTTVASAGGELDDAIAYVIQAMLQSPRFLYRIEDQRGDGEVADISEYELASRMSYILWGSSPDKELFDAAESGALYDPDVVRSQVQRMLDDPRAVRRSRQFVSEWLNLGRMDNMRPSSKKFPKWDPQLAQDMRAETLAFAEEVLWKQRRPMGELLNAQVTFLTPRLAKHYGIAPKSDQSAQYDLSDNPSRGGLMTQGSVLTVGGDEASMVTRGLLVMHELLRGVVKDPPACVDTTPVPSEPGMSQRAIAEDRIKNESCGGCHSKFEPLAFGLEKFDGIGAYHDQDEHGNALRQDGEVLIPGEAKPTAYKTSQELMNVLAASQRVKESITWKVTQFALGRPLIAEDAPVVQRIHQTAKKNGGTYQALMTAIVTSDLVQKTRTESN